MDAGPSVVHTDHETPAQGTTIMIHDHRRLVTALAALVALISITPAAGQTLSVGGSVGGGPIRLDGFDEDLWGGSGLEVAAEAGIGLSGWTKVHVRSSLAQFAPDLIHLDSVSAGGALRALTIAAALEVHPPTARVRPFGVVEIGYNAWSMTPLTIAEGNSAATEAAERIEPPARGLLLSVGGGVSYPIGASLRLRLEALYRRSPAAVGWIPLRLGLRWIR